MNLKMKLINNWKRKIEPMEPILETINLGNDENPRLIKIGSTLNKKERKDLQKLLIEFQKYLHGPMRICLELTLR